MTLYFEILGIVMSDKNHNLFGKVKKLFKKDNEKTFFGTGEVKSVEAWLQEENDQPIKENLLKENLLKENLLNENFQEENLSKEVEKKQLEKIAKSYKKANKIKDASKIEKMEMFFKNAKTEFSEEEFANRKLEILNFLNTLKNKK